MTYYETLHAREILEVRNVSLELTLSNCTRLSLVDSGFNSQATSFFGAEAGIFSAAQWLKITKKLAF